MKAEYTLVEVTTKRLLNEFINLPWIIYNDKLHDPYWVPPLKLAVNDILNPKHPFYQTSQMKKWLIYNDQKKYVGRIASIINHSHQNFHHDHVGHFGFFECVNDPEVAQLLFNQVKDDLTPYKVEKILGPVNPSTNYECGLLIEGVEDSPQIMMTYNPPYYVSLMEQAGFKKSMDLLAFNLPTDSPLPSKILRIAERIRTSHQITWRPVVKKNWMQEVELMHEIYNAAWEKNWGFIPMSKEEFIHLTKDLKDLCVEDLALFVELKGKPIGFIVALPDYNQIFQKIKNGKLFPTGLFKILTGGKKINRARIITLGIKREYRHLGLSTLFYTQIREQFAKLKQYKDVEMSWILECNDQMVKPLKLMGAKLYKTYRIYEKPLS